MNTNRILRGIVGLLGAAAATAALTVVTSGTAEAATPIDQIINAGTGKCLDVKTEDSPAFAQVQQWSCSNVAEQRWKLVPVERVQISPTSTVQTYNLMNQRSSNCAEVPPALRLQSTADIKAAACNTDPHSTSPQSEDWYLESGTVANTLRVRAVGSTMCLDLRGASSDNGAHIQQYPCNGSNAQNWRLNAVG